MGELSIRFTSSLSLGRPLYLAFHYEVYDLGTGAIIDSGNVGTAVKDASALQDADDGMRYILAAKLERARNMASPTIQVGNGKRSLAEIAERLQGWTFSEYEGSLILSHPVAGIHKVDGANTFEGRIKAVLEVAPDPIEWPEPEEPVDPIEPIGPVMPKDRVALLDLGAIQDVDADADADGETTLTRWQRFKSFTREVFTA